MMVPAPAAAAAAFLPGGEATVTNCGWAVAAAALAAAGWKVVVGPVEMNCRPEALIVD